MVTIPEIVKQAWTQLESFPVFTTVDANGLPNSIYVGCIGIYDDNTFVIADNKFCKTKANIQSGSKGAVLFITKDKAAYQIKGTIEYVTSGPLFDFMKSINPEGYPGHAAAAVKVENVYCGAEKLTG